METRSASVSSLLTYMEQAKQQWWQYHNQLQLQLQQPLSPQRRAMWHSRGRPAHSAFPLRTEPAERELRIGPHASDIVSDDREGYRGYRERVGGAGTRPCCSRKSGFFLKMRLARYPPETKPCHRLSYFEPKKLLFSEHLLAPHCVISDRGKPLSRGKMRDCSRETEQFGARPLLRKMM